MKLKNKNLLICTTTLMLGAVITPSLLTSCSIVSTTKIKVLDFNGWNDKKYSNLNTTNVSLEDVVYGSNYNDGNYLLIYGTVSNDDFLKFLYGTKEFKKDIENKNFSQSIFLKKYFDNNSLGNGELLGYKIPILLFADYPPYIPNASVANSLDGWNTPQDTYSSDDIVKEYNEKDGSEIYSADTLPNEGKFKIGLYKRYDQSAKTYRKFIKYLKDLRPDGQFSETSGIIAFKKNEKPKKYDAKDDQYESIKKFYQGTEQESTQ